MIETRAQLKTRKAKLEREYAIALDEIRRVPLGNGFATQDEMRKSAGEIYGMTIMSIERKLEFGLNWPLRSTRKRPQPSA